MRYKKKTERITCFHTMLNIHMYMMSATLARHCSFNLLSMCIIVAVRQSFFSSLGRAADRKICHFIWKSLDPKFIVIPFGKCGPRNRLERNRNSTTRRRTLSTKWKEEYYSLSYLVSVHFCSPLAPSHVCSHQNKSCLFSSFWCD